MSNSKSAETETKTGNQSDQPTHYVGIGASAGGLEAIEAFFKLMPAETGLAFIVIQHLSPDYKSLMVELLSKKTQMQVLRAEDGMVVKKNHVYLIPPKKNLTIFHGKLILKEQLHQGGLNLPIDIFFRSLAEDAGDRAIAVILSGTGSDGTRGVRDIKEHNGMVMVQGEDSAKFDGMPRAAISTGVADFILPPENMPERLLNFIQHPYESMRIEHKVLRENEDSLTRIFSELRDKTKVDFTYYKPSTIIRRIERRMTICQVANIDEYVRYLIEMPGEIMTLYKELLIGVTSFFRDTEAYERLKEDVIPDMLSRISDREIRLWVAGCSTGEEAYSLAILIKEVMEQMGINRDIKIFATDIDRDAIVHAGNGEYPESISADLDAKLLSKYFFKKGDTYVITRGVREMVVFAQHNLIKDPPFTNIDFVSCRNLLIYLQPVLQQKALQMFNFSLKADGVLFLGSSESVGDMYEHFKPLDQKYKIYRCVGNPHRPGQTDIPLLPRETHKVFHSSIQRSGESAYTTGREENWILSRFMDLIADHFIPLAVIVNQNNEIVYTVGDSEGFFKMPSGKAVYDISKMVIKDLSIPLSTGIQKVFRTHKPLSYKNIPLRYLHTSSTMSMHIYALPHRKGHEELVAVFLEKVETREQKPSDESVQVYDVSAEAQQRIRDLEVELQFTKENLQATIEELETSNEELQATNEELLASNEELQSTNEELQSTNEELYTVNTEFQNKINELTELNNDVDNLLTSSGIGKLLLDEDLVIRRFSPEICNVFRIMEKDIGRPITHLAHRIKDLDVGKAISEVIKTNRIFEKDVLTDSGRTYLMRVLPYLIGPATFSGVVVTFIDVTQLKQARENLDESRKNADEIIRYMPSGLFVYRLNEEGTLVLEQSNPEAERITGISVKRSYGKTFNDIWPAAAQAGITGSFYKVIETGTPWHTEELEYADERINGAYRIQAFKLSENRLGVSFEDITERKVAEAQRAEYYNLLAAAEEVAHIGSWRWDIEKDTVTWSDELFRIFQRDPEKGAPSYAEHPTIYSAEDMAALDAHVKRALEDGTPYAISLDVKRPDGTVRHCIARGHVERDPNGTVCRLYGSMQDVTEIVNMRRQLDEVN